MERTSLIKHILSHLNQNGLEDVASILEVESSITYETKGIRRLKQLLNENKVDEAVDFRSTDNGEDIFERFLISCRLVINKIFGLILSNNVEDGLQLIQRNMKHLIDFKFKRNESSITNEIIDKEIIILKQCSTLLFNRDKDESSLIEKMKKICHEAINLNNIISFLNNLTTTRQSKINLEEILDKVMQRQIKLCKYHNTTNNSYSYFFDHHCRKERIPYKCLLSLEQHNEEIVNIVYSNSCKYFAAILKGNNIIIYGISKTRNCTRKISTDSINNNSLTNSDNIEVVILNTILSPHNNQINSLQWNLTDTFILTSSKDKMVKLIDPFTGICKLTITGHNEMVSCAIFVENESKILSSGLDYKVSLWDLSGKIEYSVSTPGVTVSELLYSQALDLIIAVAATTNSILFYNLDNKEKGDHTPVDSIHMNDVIISCAISKLDYGRYILVNSSKATPVLNLFKLTNEKKEIERKFFGHRQERFTIKCSFGGTGEKFLLCGSEDANIYVWNRYHSIPIFILKAHSAPVNSVIWAHSDLTDVLISCSDDHTIKILADENIEKCYLSLNQSKIDRFKLEHKFVNIGENGIQNSSGGNNTTIGSSISNVLNRVNSILGNPFGEDLPSGEDI